MPDIYQQRYLEHRERKKKFQTEINKTIYSLKGKDLVFRVIKNRRSQRTFNKKPITKTEIRLLMESARFAPSSCNRQAIYIKILNEIEDLLVGGKGWINNGNKIFLIFADMKAYKSPNEVDFMPYLDAGVVIENIYLMAEVLGIGVCFVNPNIKEKIRFNNLYNKENNRFCGAMVVGHYNQKAVVPPKLT